jgi:eukaryotic-like serine/threonine-protein kinase
MENYLGKRLDGRYEIHQLLGVGGMAYVYRAYDNQEDRWVAIKILKEEFSQNAEFLKRFRNESKAIAVLNHPNIVKVYDVSFGDRIQYIVMEYIDGITLKDYISHNGALPWKEALHFTTQILKALQHAHGKGIVHRDIKPQNIMLLQNGAIKVTDFGIARFSQGETTTMTDKALGSVHYIAPEQAKGEFTSDKADIYSVGVMMYEMLTGQLPFEADNAVSVAIMQLQAEPTKPRSINPQIPVGLEEITMKAMEKNPSNRFKSAGDMLNDIERFKANPSLTFGYSFQDDISATRQVNLYNKAQPTRRSSARTTPVYEDDYEYEVELEKSKRHAKGSSILTGIVAALLIAVIAVAGYAVYNLVQNSNKEDTSLVYLPNFVGMNYDSEIANNSEYSDFVFTVKTQYDESKSEGEVIRQSPNGGKDVKKGKEVTLVVNRTEQSENTALEMPDFTNYSQSDATSALSENGLNYEIQTQNDDTVASGNVIRTDPAAGSTVNKGDTVTVYVSLGPSETTVSVPSILYSSYDYAVTLLNDAGLVVGSVSYDDSSSMDSGTVLSCSPEVGADVSKGSSINLVVARGTTDVSLTITLPSGVNEDLNLKVYCDGELQTDTYVNPTYSSTYTVVFSGSSGSQQITATLNGSDYVTCTADYDSGNITNFNQYSYETDVVTPDDESSEEYDNTEDYTG